MFAESVKRKAREEGRIDGRREGREEARKERRARRLKRWEEAYPQFGLEVSGVLMLPRMPEVERFLDGEPEE